MGWFLVAAIAMPAFFKFMKGKAPHEVAFYISFLCGSFSSWA